MDIQEKKKQLSINNKREDKYTTNNIRKNKCAITKKSDLFQQID